MNDYNILVGGDTKISDIEDNLSVLVSTILLSAELDLGMEFGGENICRYTSENIVVKAPNNVIARFFQFTINRNANLPTIENLKPNVIVDDKKVVINYNIKSNEIVINWILVAVDIVKIARLEHGKDIPQETPYYKWLAGKLGYGCEILKIPSNNWYHAKKYVYDDIYGADS